MYNNLRVTIAGVNKQNRGTEVKRQENPLNRAGSPAYKRKNQKPVRYGVSFPAISIYYFKPSVLCCLNSLVFLRSVAGRPLIVLPQLICDLRVGQLYILPLGVIDLSSWASDRQGLAWLIWVLCK